MKGFRSKHRNSPYIFSGSCIPTNESSFILLALSRLTKTVEDYWWWLSNNKIIACSDIVCKNSCSVREIQLREIVVSLSHCSCYHHYQTFQVSRNYREIPAFLFAFTYHTWSDFLPAFLNLNLTCRGFFLWGNYSHLFSFAQCSTYSFCQVNASTQRSLEKSWKCVSQSHIKKRQKAGRLLSLRSAIFCRLGRRSDE
jgi:hypothetical protein